MPVRSHQLAEDRITATGGIDTVIYTAPPGSTPVIKDALLEIDGGQQNNGQVYVKTAAGTHVAFLIGTGVNNGVSTNHFVGFVVLKGGDTVHLVANITVSGEVNVIVSGAVLG